ncbi:splicing factor 3A subunit 2-like [Nasonia vitripennis]|uniref:Uncharacterized protein n=1 Tax=Nasonia vitripennis TaxID=7425 RepID=A0A7M7PZC0_NASVI|nr:splicing factor 3A subunit 2-like [Nasonia vitripennis]
MRLLSSTTLLLVLVGVALAVPAKRKLEKKSISDSLAPKAIEPVEQRLDEPTKLSDAALAEIAGESVDRAKKQTTKFCVEFHQDKPTQVDCDELNNRPIPLPPPASIPSEPQEPVPPPPPPPAPAPVPQQQPEEYKFQVPCEPEMAAFYVQPPREIVYVPTGNCAPQAPALLHVPSSNPIYTVHTNAESSAAPSINVLHLPSGSLPSTGHGVTPTVHVSPFSGAGGINPTVIPLHTNSGAGIAPAHTPSLVHVIRPSPLQHHGIHHGAVPLYGPEGLHGTHHLNGIECTCTSSLAKSTDGSSQRNAQPEQPGSPMIAMSGQPSSPMIMSEQPGSPMMMVSSDSGSPSMAGKSMDMRYVPLVRPLSNVNHHQVIYQQQAMGMHGMGGMHGYPIRGYPMHRGIYPGMLRSNADCLQDSFGNSAQIMPQGLRLSREQEAEASGQPE